MAMFIVCARLDAVYSGDASVFTPRRGRVTDIGFAEDGRTLMTRRPRRPAKLPYDDWCVDKFLNIDSSAAGSDHGMVEIAETLVYDGYNRGDIDFTGVSVKLDLTESQLDAYLSYIGDEKRPELRDHQRWSGEIVLRMAAPFFDFPMPRGSSDPWSPGDTVGTLRPIITFHLSGLTVWKLRNADGDRVPFADAMANDFADLSPSLSLG